jgi:hypothetical protein
MSTVTTESLIGRAWALHRDGRNDQAVAEFDRALKDNPNDIDANFGLGLVQHALGRNEQAVASFTRARQLVMQALEQNPDDDRWLMLARMCEQRLSEITGEALSPNTPKMRTRTQQAVAVGAATPPTTNFGSTPASTTMRNAAASSFSPDLPSHYERFPSRNEIIAAIAGIVPFFVSISSSSTQTVNGEVVSQSYFDIVDVVGGLIAIVATITVFRMLGKTDPDDRVKRIAAIVVLLLLGVYQVAHGIGIII